MSKAQMEMMGLVIIVVLITTIFLFVLRFNIDTDPEAQRQDFIHSELAANTLSAMLRMDSRCERLTMTELFQECGRDPDSGDMNEIVCGEGSASTTHSFCDAARTAIEPLLQSTLFDRGYSYRFFMTSTVTEDAKYLPLSETVGDADCDTGRKVEVYPIPLHPGTMFIRLELCE